MGHREDLLAGAKKCIYEKGYARTTARDIVAASGTNLASIGYHYGSKEALLNRAMFEAIAEVDTEIEEAAAASVGPDATPGQRVAAYWTVLLDRFQQHRQVWAASFEIFPHIEQMPEIRQSVVEGIQQARDGWSRLFHGTEVGDDPKKAHAVGSVYYTLMAGTLAQWLVDPEHAPSAAEIVEGLRIIAASFAADAAADAADHAGDDPADTPATRA